MKRDGYHLDVEQCLQCGDGYYPPENCPKSTNGLGKCKGGHYLPICKPCRVIRREKTTKSAKDRWWNKVKLNRPPHKKDVILDILRKGPVTIDELLFNNITIKAQILALRRSGYDIRFERRYILVREPKESIIDTIP